MEDVQPELLADFPVTIHLPVQWGDLDAFGHVNGVMYFRWLESSRIAYLDQVGFSHTPGGEAMSPILASIKCDYREQLNHPDRIQVGASVTKIGRTSLTLLHAIYSHTSNSIVAEGESIIVAFDYTSNSSIPIPEEIRTAIDKLENR